jgi:hypothetical protein
MAIISKSKTEVSWRAPTLTPPFELGAILPTFVHRLSRAYALSSLFYHRQVRSHIHGPGDGFHFFARCLAYQFVALPPDTG